MRWLSDDRPDSPAHSPPTTPPSFHLERAIAAIMQGNSAVWDRTNARSFRFGWPLVSRNPSDSYTAVYRGCTGQILISKTGELGDRIDRSSSSRFRRVG